MNRRRFLTIAAAVLTCRHAHADVTQWQASALGGTVSIDLRGSRRLSAQAGQYIAAIIEEIEAAASLFRQDSALSRLNVDGVLPDPPRALMDLIATSDRMHHATRGVFDPTVQPLWRALAEGGDPVAARRLIGWRDVNAGDPVRLRPGQALTFNGVAQGYAADRVRSLLAELGYDQVLVDMGEFAARGGPFRVGIEDPELGPVATRTLTGTAIATSSPAAMRLGGSFHILSPSGSLPQWSTISVEATSAATADALSTAFCVMDKSAILATMSAMPEIHQVTAVDLKGDVSTFD